MSAYEEYSLTELLAELRQNFLTLEQLVSDPRWTQIVGPPTTPPASSAWDVGTPWVGLCEQCGKYDAQPEDTYCMVCRVAIDEWCRRWANERGIQL